LSGLQRRSLEVASQKVLDARASVGGSLVDIYDPDMTPEPLVRAHRGLDRVVDSIYAPKRSGLTEPARMAVLLERYRVLAGPAPARC
jgi:hypothetical protein